MANDRLRDAMYRKQMTPSDLASTLKVDPKTVERWITQNRIPYPRYRYALAALLAESQTYLWPDATQNRAGNEPPRSEVVRLYPRRATVPTEMWQRLLADATSDIAILVYAALFLPEQYPRLISTLTEKAAAGARIRIALGDPEAGEVAKRGTEEGIGDAIAAKIRNVLSWYQKLREVAGISIRLHRTTLYNSIYQFDDEMLVNTHVFGFPAAHAPTLHLRQTADGELFGLYADSFDRVWSTARPAWGQQGEP
ncbi:XRE family transcriptional regulator [Micromonospora echinofusca]|uniref:XRE family transcriptional regulator n=1 Tax=Micromonospora echinofusca TaxID=47858 RepID=A0ABS3VPB9_MICEH|nr:XRE family transcriptional regulator [Micromonospora echinofusca]MBO4206384.1 XRE family transcriptional regulator [Micromonospora echinofusca]